MRDYANYGTLNQIYIAGTSSSKVFSYSKYWKEPRSKGHNNLTFSDDNSKLQNPAKCDVDRVEYFGASDISLLNYQRSNHLYLTSVCASYV